MRDRSQPEPLTATETWFVKRGLPQFIDGYDSSEHVWTRATPALVLIIFLQFGLLSLGTAVYALLRAGGRGDEPPAVQALLELGFSVALLVSYLIWSRTTHGVWLAVPKQVGWPPLALFVLGPALVTLPDGVTSALLLGLEQLAVLAGVYLVTRWGLIALTRWALRETVEHLGSLYRVVIKALPLLLVALMVLFTTTETWQVAAALEPRWMWTSIGLLLVLAVLVTWDRTRQTLRQLQPDRGRDEIAASCAGTPLAGLPLAADPNPHRVSLRPAERANLWFAALSIQVIQVALIAVVVWAFFMAFGAITVTLAVQEAWLGSQYSSNVIIQFGTSHGITQELIRASTFMAGFAAFYTTVAAESDVVFRASFDDNIAADLQESLDVRAAYLTARPAQTP